MKSDDEIIRERCPELAEANESIESLKPKDLRLRSGWLDLTVSISVRNVIAIRTAFLKLAREKEGLPGRISEIIGHIKNKDYGLAETKAGILWDELVGNKGGS